MGCLHYARGCSGTTQSKVRVVSVPYEWPEWWKRLYLSLVDTVVRWSTLSPVPQKCRYLCRWTPVEVRTHKLAPYPVAQKPVCGYITHYTTLTPHLLEEGLWTLQYTTTLHCPALLRYSATLCTALHYTTLHFTAQHCTTRHMSSKEYHTTLHSTSCSVV